MALASAETAALLLTNRRLLQGIVGLVAALLMLGAGTLYLSYSNRSIKYTTISGDISLAVPGELDEEVVKSFAESVIARLGNVSPESIDGVSSWVMRRAEPRMRAQFQAWLATEKDRIRGDDMVFQVENLEVVGIKRTSTFGTPVYRVTVRGRQTIWIASERLEPRLIDIPLDITVGPVGTQIDLVIRTLRIPQLLTIEGAIINVINR